MFLQKILVAIITLFSFALCCRSKLKPISKNKVIECIYKNVTEPQNHSYPVENGTTDYFFHKNLSFLWHPSYTLPCYELDVRLFDYSNGITDQYLKKFRRFTNIHMECQAYFQGEETCHFFHV